MPRGLIEEGEHGLDGGHRIHDDPDLRRNPEGAADASHSLLIGIGEEIDP
jgi:hypothetical protein